MATLELLPKNEHQDTFGSENIKNLNIALTSPINEEESYKIEFVKCYLTLNVSLEHLKLCFRNRILLTAMQELVSDQWLRQ